MPHEKIASRFSRGSQNATKIGKIFFDTNKLLRDPVTHKLNQSGQCRSWRPNPDHILKFFAINIFRKMGTVTADSSAESLIGPDRANKRKTRKNLGRPQICVLKFKIHMPISTKILE